MHTEHWYVYAWWTQLRLFIILKGITWLLRWLATNVIWLLQWSDRRSAATRTGQNAAAGVEQGWVGAQDGAARRRRASVSTDLALDLSSTPPATGASPPHDIASGWDSIKPLFINWKNLCWICSVQQLSRRRWTSNPIPLIMRIGSIR